MVSSPVINSPRDDDTSPTATRALSKSEHPEFPHTEIFRPAVTAAEAALWAGVRTCPKIGNVPCPKSPVVILSDFFIIVLILFILLCGFQMKKRFGTKPCEMIDV